jgi:hypothetical protein
MDSASIGLSRGPISPITLARPAAVPTMEEPNLFSICVIAFVAVMFLLGFEAVVIALISRCFPERKTEGELINEAIQQAVTSRFPGAKLVAVEEMKPAPVDSHAARPN